MMRKNWWLKNANGEHRTLDEIKAAEKACEARLREEATGVDRLARAAKENYPIEKAMLSVYAERLRDRVLASAKIANLRAEVTTNAFNLSAEDEAEAPGEFEFAVLDAVTAGARAENERMPNVVGKWTVSRITSQYACNGGGCERRIPMVVATLYTPSGTREIEFTTAPACHHGEEEE